jgi:hypothetical protein
MSGAKDILTEAFARDAINLSDQARILKLQALTIDLADALSDMLRIYPEWDALSEKARAALIKAGL